MRRVVGVLLLAAACAHSSSDHWNDGSASERAAAAEEPDADPVDAELEAAKKRLAVRQVGCAFQSMGDAAGARLCTAEVNADRRMIELQQSEHREQQANRQLITDLAAQEAAAEQSARDAEAHRERGQLEAQAASSAAAASAEAARAERLRRATADSKTAPPWVCFQGTLAGLATGWCTKAADSCAAEARGFAKMQGVAVTVTQECKPQPLAACVIATSVLQATRKPECFASFAGCDAYRAHLLTGTDFSDVTECEPMPTTWIDPGGTVSPFD